MEIRIPAEVVDYQVRNYIGKDGQPKTFRDLMARVGSHVVSLRVSNVYPYTKLEEVTDHTELILNVTPFGKDRAAQFVVVNSR